MTCHILKQIFIWVDKATSKCQRLPRKNFNTGHKKPSSKLLVRVFEENLQHSLFLFPFDVTQRWNKPIAEEHIQFRRTQRPLR